jgi:hypothetical protein
MPRLPRVFERASAASDSLMRKTAEPGRFDRPG